MLHLDCIHKRSWTNLIIEWASLVLDSVLCGSKKYPSRDPFAHLLKGSLQTFLNAMTYPDRTVYPVSGQSCVFCIVCLCPRCT